MAPLLTADQRKQVYRLRFPKGVEAEFWADWADKIRRPVQIIAIAGLVLAATYLAITFLVPEGAGEGKWASVRSVAAVVPILIATFFLTRTRIWQWINPALLWLILIAMMFANGYSLLQRTQETYERGMISNWMFFSVIVIGCGLALVRSAAVSMTLLAAGYLWLSYGFRPLSEPARTANLVVLWQTIVFAMAAAYVAEVRARREFMLQKLLEEERAKTQEVLSNVLPEQIAHRLKTSPGVLAERHEDACVLFADIVDFTPYVVAHSAEEVLRLLDEVFSRFDELVERRGLEKIKTVGDAYMVAGGVLDGGMNHIHQMADLSLEFRDAAREMGVRMRIGMDCGPIVAGVIGRKKYLYDLWGEAVNVASRMESLGVADRIQVTAGVADRLRNSFELEERGVVEVKGIGPVSTYFLLSRSTSSSSSSSPSSGSPVFASGSPSAPP